MAYWRCPNDFKHAVYVALLAKFRINVIKTGLVAQIISKLLLLVPTLVITQRNERQVRLLEGLLTQEYNLAALPIRA